MKRRLYIDGNTVYGIDEECMRRRQEAEGKETENYMTILLCAALKQDQTFHDS